ncbi:Crp/Fnr family transcriptional regulator [uncultured Cytophaga sp.]|uniref:Crp/Fnr family transcriptional regulator n=1 Tax=uncultured Cytophaga sp. TaxID=160238 RepID=UPI00260DEE92|nr:Crp/Fnr family transcriptional regulator [uncultured Cytophaga sp.]
MQAPLLTINEELFQYGIVKTFPVDYVLLQESGAIRSIPIVLKGSLKVMRTEEDGREILLYYILPGESCIMSFLAGLNDDTSKVKAVVEDEAEILLIPLDKASQLVRTNPQWVDFIFKLYHKRFEELLNVVNAVAFQKLDVRVLDALTKKAASAKTNELQITHQQLADELGTSREVISRVLKQMEHEKLVVLSRNKITLIQK